jgi:hypothetical protein
MRGIAFSARKAAGCLFCAITSSIGLTPGFFQRAAEGSNGTRQLRVQRIGNEPQIVDYALRTDGTPVVQVYGSPEEPDQQIPLFGGQGERWGLCMFGHPENSP